MDLLIITIIGAGFAAIVFALGRLTCPRHDRVPLSQVDRVILWTTLCRGWMVLGQFAPLTMIVDDRREGSA
ncbi:hypothetical protein [Brevibacterium casei]|uniref:hypothetical protein n=1 Tax=Brevibacterium casei TaxID=33889 RepID=UPI00223BE663|nr:hypothetical protein [Brevibacterium casei]MCT1551638.1 hypothetical protein [Brevibacterium casei]MCT1561142.1 hypothetical protein [Brevibacterium casei]MCT2207029.1 hypothetical protein [Brevibacterium casei]